MRTKENDEELSKLQQANEQLQKTITEMQDRLSDDKREGEWVKRDVHERELKLADLEASARVSAEEVTYLRKVREDLLRERDDLLQDLHGY